MGACVFRWALPACLLFSMLLTGCISSKPLDVAKPPSSDSGAVVLRIVSDGYHGHRDFTRFVLAARIRRDGASAGSGPSRVRLVRERGATNSSVVLGGVVAPGLYYLEGLETGQESYPFKEDALRFEVKAGGTSFLGTLVYYGGGEVPQHVPLDAASRESFEQSFPAIFGTLSAKRELMLPVSSGLPDALRSVSALKRYAQASDQWAQLENGDFAAPGRLGTVLYRKQGSSRRVVLDVGDWREVLAVSAFMGGLLVAGEEGLLRFSADGGATWRAMPSPGRGMIRAVRPLTQGGVMAIVRTGDRWSAHATQDAFAGGWREVAEFSFEESRGADDPLVSRAGGTQKRDLPDPDWQPLPRVVGVANGVGLMRTDGAYRLVDPSGQVRSALAGPVADLKATRDGLLSIRKWRAVGMSLSADEGMTWSDLRLLPSTLAVAFQDRRTYFAIAAASADGLRRQYATYVTRDGGETWSQSGTSPVEPGQAVRLWVTTEGALQIEVETGDVLQSVDAGARWTTLPE